MAIELQVTSVTALVTSEPRDGRSTTAAGTTGR